ncbi:unnamed protein product [Rotaria magnacalcarata]|uniref:Uncharacterized protein n=1 Tax=Rotaria magnacalcarata TaxID=392030 RepID=A0A8S2J4M4_9BILA|nr:unnamed protein product [Rotaria magnacalcarata]
MATTQDSYDKNEENPEIFVLMRDIVTNMHHIVRRSKVITSKKLEKLQTDDEVHQKEPTSNQDRSRRALSNALIIFFPRPTHHREKSKILQNLP